MHCPHPRFRGQVRTATPSGWYFNVGSTELASRFQSLPAILHKHRHSPMQKLVKVHGVFPSCRGRLHHHKHFNFAESLEDTVWPSLRHSCGSELTDKEFRYLRTVIVTAAVYWDFNQELAPHHLIFQHRAGVRPYTSTFVLAESCVLVNSCSHRFSATLSTFGCTPTIYQGIPSPEVTVSICRVPSPEFSQAP